MKIITVLGTRPEIIKLSPVIDLLEKDSFFDHKIIHTGQHYDFNMDRVFFEELHLPEPDFMLNIGSHPRDEQLNLMVEKISSILTLEKPDLVIVQGDTNSTLAGARAAKKCGIKLMHIEAGCRSFNKEMPEEINRIEVDHISDTLIVPDEKSVRNLLAENISSEKIFLLGSTTFDVVSRNKKFVDIRSKVSNKLYGLEKKNFILATIHRAENTNDPIIFTGIMDALHEIARDVPIIFPVHPRTRKIIENLNHKVMNNKNITFTNPESYFDFLTLLSNCRFCISDSGGIQEEAAALNIPCLIIRNETEWMRLVEAGKNRLIGTKKEHIVSAVLELWDDANELESIRSKSSPFLPDVSKKIIEVLKR